ncbi:tetratricopeptide repeat protein [Patescibacteria group bacterium]|nr:tetratricopeptide repeat protein [Patescibacteria group bacterium]MBU4347768.1 tetratricopeptide repeat protein [Patescibacteria group bacterium]MBU4454955.1 tetratricopeptide repeat protein [Patescibacteria group bacterium]MCG2690844.1 tetratricopeptide repeat protein [Candidatus Parcubacteria bacterium]
MELIVKNGTNNYLFYSTLANKYYEIGNKEKAIEYAEKSAEINPEVKDKVEKFTPVK